METFPKKKTKQENDYRLMHDRCAFKLPHEYTPNITKSLTRIIYRYVIRSPFSIGMLSPILSRGLNN